MANGLKMAVIHAIEELLKRGWSHRRIARELGIHRETVARYAQRGNSKPAISTPGSGPPCGRKSHCHPYGDLIGWKGGSGSLCRMRKMAKARAVLAYVWVQYLGRNRCQLARAISVSPTTISAGVRRVEENCPRESDMDRWCREDAQ